MRPSPSPSRACSRAGWRCPPSSPSPPLPRLAVARTCDADRLQRRAPLREALAVDRGGPPVLASRRALLLPLDPRATRPVARVAPRLDDGRLHGRQADQRGVDVGGGLPRVLARRAHRASVLRTAHRRRGGRDAGDASTTATSCPRRSPIPSSSLRRRPRARASQAPSRRMTIAVPLICLVAVATRVQFLVLPLGYLAAVRSVRTRAIPAPPRFLRSSCGGARLRLLGVPGAFGQYGEARHLGFSAGGVAHWAARERHLLMYSIGLAVVAGAIVRPRLHARPATQPVRACRRSADADLDRASSSARRR